ncbi:MAG: hypothetical protein JKY65_32735, partial [Planctomycetes bacterium]|nr:hypothetical protein [Planctomycetota bacterium]
GELERADAALSEAKAHAPEAFEVKLALALRAAKEKDGQAAEAILELVDAEEAGTPRVAARVARQLWLLGLGERALVAAGRPIKALPLVARASLVAEDAKIAPALRDGLHERTIELAREAKDTPRLEAAFERKGLFLAALKAVSVRKEARKGKFTPGSLQRATLEEVRAVPLDPTAYMSHFALGQRDDGYETLVLGVELDPTSAQMLQVGKLLKGMPLISFDRDLRYETDSDLPLRADSALMAAFRCIHRRSRGQTPTIAEFEAAASALDGYVQRFPHMPSGAFLRGQIRLHLGDAGGAYEDMIRAGGLVSPFSKKGDPSFAVFSAAAATVVLGDEGRLAYFLQASARAARARAATPEAETRRYKAKRRAEANSLGGFLPSLPGGKDANRRLLVACATEYRHEDAPAFHRLLETVLH